MERVYTGREVFQFMKEKKLNNVVSLFIIIFIIYLKYATFESQIIVCLSICD